VSILLPAARRSNQPPLWSRPAQLVERGLKSDVLGDAAGEDNQHEGELPPEIGAIECRAGGCGEAGRFKIRFEPIASVSRFGFEGLHGAHGT
jgi:hypothetical protein